MACSADADVPSSTVHLSIDCCRRCSCAAELTNFSARPMGTEGLQACADSSASWLTFSILSIISVSTSYFWYYNKEYLPVITVQDASATSEHYVPYCFGEYQLPETGVAGG